MTPARSTCRTSMVSLLSLKTFKASTSSPCHPVHYVYIYMHERHCLVVVRHMAVHTCFTTMSSRRSSFVLACWEPCCAAFAFFLFGGSPSLLLDGSAAGCCALGTPTVSSLTELLKRTRVTRRCICAGTPSCDTGTVSLHQEVFEKIVHLVT